MDSTRNLVNPDGARVLPVSELVRQARRLLEQGLPLCWVEGEVSNLTRASSGHLYFTLKDDSGQLRCTMWRNRAQLLPFQLAEGMRIEVRAQLTVYEARGDLQLSVEHLRRAGQGNLFEALLRLKSKLEAEGLFDPALRRPLPVLPRRIGIVTSPNAAALQDVMAALRRRAPSLRAVLYPCPVQGETAGAQIAASIDTASRRCQQDGIEALLVCRGGGSLEDLWAFNDEAVVRAIRRCAVPVVTGVGHETDTCLCDFAADLRAATPTAAAEALSAGHLALQTRLPELATRLARTAMRAIDRAHQRLDLAERSLRHPRQQLAMLEHRLGALGLRLEHALSRQKRTLQDRLARCERRLMLLRPDLRLRKARLEELRQRLRQAGAGWLHQQSLHLDRLGAGLDALNPAAVMQRGYAIVRDPQGQIVRDSASLRQGDLLRIRFGEGSAEAEVRETHSQGQ